MAKTGKLYRSLLLYSMGFFCLHGEAELIQNSKQKYLQIRPREIQYESDFESHSDKQEDGDDIIAMENYLKKKRYLSTRIGKLKLHRLYMEKPEVKKKKKRQRKAKGNNELTLILLFIEKLISIPVDDEGTNIQIPIKDNQEQNLQNEVENIVNPQNQGTLQYFN